MTRPPVRDIQPVTSVTPSAGAVPAALTGPRPGGEVMPSAKVWGDKEAEAAGIYEPSTRVASAEPMANRTSPPIVAQAAPAPVPQAPAGIPGVQAAYIRSLMANPRTRDYGAALYQKAMAEIAQANKPTDEIREFEYSQRNPRFKDYKTDLKRARASTNSA